MAVDSNMIHICIYIFTINHLSRYIIKKKKKKKSLQTFKCINYWMALTLRFCATIITKHFFFFPPGVLKRVDGREKSMRNTFNILVLSSLQAATSYRKSTEEQVPSSCWFWLCWYVDGFFFLFWRSWSFIAICGLRADRRIKKSEVLAYWIANKSLTNALHSLLLYPFFLKSFSVSGGFFFFFFYPSRHGMVSPPQIVRNKRLARVQKYNFISEKTNTNMVQRQKK